MARIVFVFALAALCAGCSSTVVRDANDPTGANKSGPDIATLASYFEKSSGRTHIVLVHGVGFHCPTYGLDPTSGWLSAKTIAKLGLLPANNGPSAPPLFIPDIQNQIVDQNSGVYLLQREYSYLRKNGTYADVQVSEITWSGLTAWLKLQELGADYSQKVAPGDGRDKLPSGVPEAIACPGVPVTTYPFNREILNRVIKESTLDGALSDAVIYVGTYGPKIERGVAEILCRLVSSKTYAGTDRCQWEDADASKPQASFIFMTHSLGSRIIFDTLLDLDGRPTRETGPVFKDIGEGGRAVVEKIIANTRSIYMFANQLPILTLADAPPTLTSGGSPSFINTPQYRDIDATRKGVVPQSKESSSAKERSAPHLLWFAAVKSSLPPPQGGESVKLDVVAFSDPNDLLSYTIPPWFEQDMGNLQFQITNVSVRNAFHWFHVIEDPAAAHDDYMSNSHVWDVIRCGATHGTVNCP